MYVHREARSRTLVAAQAAQRDEARRGEARRGEERRDRARCEESAARGQIVVTPSPSARPARPQPGDEHVVRAHIPHASTALSGRHAAAGARTARTALPTLNRVSRGLSRRAPPAARKVRGARRRLSRGCLGSAAPAHADDPFRHTLTFAREEFFQQERMRPPVISRRRR